MRFRCLFVLFLVCLPCSAASVADFGAKGDGVTDDGPALRQALATVNATGGVLDVPPGRFR